MNIRDLPRHGTGIYTTGPNRPISLQLPAGTHVRALSGTVWLTQEGDIRDVVLHPGDDFKTAQDGLVVMNGVDDVATVYVTGNEEARRTLRITPELVSAIEADARRLRNREIARLVRFARNGIRRVFSALKVRLP